MAELSAEDRDAFGRAVTARRAELGLSRKDVVARSGLSYSYVANIESGYKQPSAKSLHMLAEALEVRPSELLERADALAAMARESASSGRTTANARSWFRDGSRVLSTIRSEPPDHEMRSLVREVVREELEAVNPASDDVALQMSAGSLASMTAPRSPARKRPTPRLPAGIRAALPDWLTTPADSGVEMAVQSVVLERLHRLDPRSSPDEVQAAIDDALNHLIKQARRRRRNPAPKPK